MPGKNGHIYDFELCITSGVYPAAHIASVDLRQALPEEYGHYPER